MYNGAMSDLQAYRVTHLLGAWTYGMAGAVTAVLAGQGSLAAFFVLAFVVAPAATLSVLTWDRMVKEEYR